MKLLNKTIGLIAFAVLLVPRSAQACAVCFGNSDSKLSQGMLAGFVALFIYLARRAAAVAALDKQSTESKA